MAKVPPKTAEESLRAKAEAEASAAALGLSRKRIHTATGTDNKFLQNRMLDQTLSTVWLQKGQKQDDAIMATLAALEAVAPADGLEGMLATQMVATHEAAMECLRRAMIAEQTFEGRDVNLKHAEKLLQIFARQVEALDKHRGKGQQKIIVEHVTVEAGGQAIVGNVEAPARKNSAAPEAQRTLSDQSAAAVDLTDLTGAGTRQVKQWVRRREQ